MILGDAQEGSAEFSDERIEVNIRIRRSTGGDVSTMQTMEAVDKALHGALVAAGFAFAGQILGEWHETRGTESRQAREI